MSTDVESSAPDPGIPEPPGLFRIDEVARRVGNYEWTERRLARILGGWVESVGTAEVKVVLERHGYQHTRHADLWHARMPELPELPVDRLTQAPNDAYRGFMDALGDPDVADATLARLVGVYRVLLPHLVAVYRFHASATSRITDAPMARTLDGILADDGEQLAEAELLLQSLIRTPDRVEVAARRHARLQKLLVVAGGVAGSESLGR